MGIVMLDKVEKNQEFRKGNEMLTKIINKFFKQIFKNLTNWLKMLFSLSKMSRHYALMIGVIIIYKGKKLRDKHFQCIWIIPLTPLKAECIKMKEKYGRFECVCKSHITILTFSICWKGQQHDDEKFNRK